MRHGTAWAIFACALVLVLLGLGIILGMAGWVGVSFVAIPALVVLGAVGLLFVVAGLAGIAISMSMRMY
ncbi:MAG: hypothetical protein LC620_05915, partial [Halobacteriales archaeon]|nr:hypothetical protein [Halobacteriales archaeon]